VGEGRGEGELNALLVIAKEQSKRGNLTFAFIFPDIHINCVKKIDYRVVKTFTAWGGIKCFRRSNLFLAIYVCRVIFASFRATALVSAKDRAGAGGSALTSHH
jgi:hypothetical protein